MTYRRADLRIESGSSSDGRSWTLAVTVHVPDADRLSTRPPLLACLPGGGYNRHYFDLREPGYSEARHHVGNGVIVVAIDHLGVGESDVPEGEPASLSTVAAANHAALQVIVARMRSGRLIRGMDPIAPSAVIGEGQSMGGHVALMMQAGHRSFDALALLGSSVVCTRLPAVRAADEICLLGEPDPSEVLVKLASYDWTYPFHWDDVPEQFIRAEAAARAGTGPLPYWQSATFPHAVDLMMPGIVAREAAAVTSPVLIAMGERDVCQDPIRELATFTSCRDLSLFVGKKMAHMHNFAGTRTKLWRRVDDFVRQVARSADAAYGDAGE